MGSPLETRGPEPVMANSSPAALNMGLHRILPQTRRWQRTLAVNYTGIAGLLMVLPIVVAAIFAQFIAPVSPLVQDLEQTLRPPAWLPGGTPSHFLGTDHLGRDILSRVIYGSRVSLLVGFTAVFVQGGVGSILGLIAGYYGGRFDRIIMRAADIQLAIPWLVLALAMVAVLGPSLQNVVIVLGITGWVSYCRVVRAQVLSIREQDFVEAARALGSPDRRILTAHVLPNTTNAIVVIATLEVARMIIAEASLSFLGLGIQPPTPSWGGMVSEGRSYLTIAWWFSTFPGLAIFLTALGINLLGDWVRDRLDPTTTP